MTANSIYLITSDTYLSTRIGENVLKPDGYAVTVLNSQEKSLELIKSAPPHLVMVGERLLDGSGASFVSDLLNRFPNLMIIYLSAMPDPAGEGKMLRKGLVDYLPENADRGVIQNAVQQGLERQNRLDSWFRLESRRTTKSLKKKLDGLEAFQRVARSVTSILDLDNVLKAAVDSAVELTGAEEGSLLLLDESNGELYMRAARNFQDEFVRTFRLPIHDTLPGQVLRSGKPLFLDESVPQKIKTSYLVQNLIYVPLVVQGRVIGVLGVDNRKKGHPFNEQHMTLVAALADYAAIAVENARLYTRTEIERKKLETILTHVDDGVIVADLDGRILLVNQTLRNALRITENNVTGRPVKDIIQHPDLLDLFIDEKRTQPSRMEITLEDGRVFNAHLTPIPEVGLAVTMQDITHLKELDRIKSDFVSTVSHDLRSPLTAILGYVELIDRAGPINDTQREFIHRVQFSVNNITSLINDLLDLGRIEAGFDSLKEIVPLPAIIRYAVEGMRSRFEEKRQEIVIEISDEGMSVLGNPIRLRQMAGNLVGNAVKYTPDCGVIYLKANSEEGQIIFQVIDNGPGIPPADQPYIFDKFYRASNVPLEIPGTGLGLAIVKSIVENHQGRIWVNSTVGQGTTFTVVMPVADEGL